MKKKIAIPVDENGFLDAHFGHCKWFALFDIEDAAVVFAENAIPPPHKPGALPKWLTGKGVTEIIAGGMGERAIKMFDKRGIKTFTGAPKVKASELIQKRIQGTLTQSLNSCPHH